MVVPVWSLKYCVMVFKLYHHLNNMRTFGQWHSGTYWEGILLESGTQGACRHPSNDREGSRGGAGGTVAPPTGLLGGGGALPLQLN
jgi:hypothetical protein